MEDSDNLNGHEKAAVITYRLMSGEVLTVPQIAREFHMTYQGAYKIMVGISRVLPIIDEYEATHVKDDPSALPGQNPGNFAPRRWRILDLD